MQLVVAVTVVIGASLAETGSAFGIVGTTALAEIGTTHGVSASIRPPPGACNSDLQDNQNSRSQQKIVGNQTISR